MNYTGFISIFSFFAFGFLPFLGLGQNMKRVRWHIEELCKPEFFGRGYTKEGDKKAASFLIGRLQDAGLKPVQGVWQQPFPMDIVVFDGELQLTIQGKKMNVGTDYLVEPHSRAGKGKAKLLNMDSTYWLEPKKLNKFIASDLSGKCLAGSSSFYKNLFLADQKVVKKAMEAGCWVEFVEKLPASTLADHSFTPPWFKVVSGSVPKKIKKMEWEVENQLLQGYSSQNVWGMVEGTEQKDSFLLITAHYDHLGGMGKEAYFPGANDNATGVSMLLELAYLIAEKPLKKSVIFLLFSGEEAGLLGSKYCSQHFPYDLKQISFLVNLDLMSTGDKAITSVNGTCCLQEFRLLDSLNTKDSLVPFIRKRGQAPNSDHYYFNQMGVKGFFLYTEGAQPTEYHSVHDTPEKLPLSRYEASFKLVLAFLKSLDNR